MSYRQNTVQVTCTNNDKVATATLIMHKPEAIVVELMGQVRITMKKHPNRPGTYIGNSGGLEFICKP